MMREQDTFFWILASGIHEMKNSLALMRQELDEVMPLLQEKDPQRAEVLAYETARLSHDMVQLLNLYKMGQGFSLQVDEVYVPDFFLGLEAEHGQLLRSRGLDLLLVCEAELLWFFDERLVSSVFNTLINNAMRYARGMVQLWAGEMEGRLCLQVADDGPGYPKDLLQLGNAPGADLESSTGSTGLGLFFAGKVARLHENQGRTGITRLFNGEPLGGGVFQLLLP